MGIHGKKEDGVALILTLGILLFLLILALGFASSSLTQKKAAGNAANLASARLLAESAVEKCLAGLAYYTDNFPSAAFDEIRSIEEDDYTSDNRKTFDFINRINTKVGGVEYYKLPSPYNPDSPKAVHWQYVYDGKADTDPDKRIIGRYAYIVRPSGGKLNPGFCVSHADTNGNPNGDDYYPDGTSRDESSTMQERKGKDVCEIPIGKLVYSSPNLTAADLKNLSTNGAGGGLLPDGGTWADLDTIFSTLGITDGNKKQIWDEDWFAVNNTPDPERFWVDSNGDGLQDANEWFHRFNIARTDWPNSNAAAITFRDDYILHAPTAWSAAPSDGTGIPWINNWKDASGNWPDAATKKNQIAANIIDYCDTNSEATRDSDTFPTFTGNDMTPYINELGINVECSTTVTYVAGPPEKRRFNYDINVIFGAERIDMYPGITPGNAVFTILEGTVSYKYKTSNGGVSSEQTIDLAGLATTVSNGSIPGYKFLWGGASSASKSDESGNSTDAGFVDVKVQIKRVKLESPSGTFADFAMPDGAGDWSAVVENLASRAADGGPTTQDAYFSYQANDPRQNLHSDDWPQATGNAAADYAIAGGTPDAANTGVTCTSEGDAEAGSTPTTISTAFIRNGPMQSPWELGFIHRGAKWETINLKKYNETEGVSSTAGGNTYEKGDANILDQIKMHTKHSIFGKVNIRAPQNEAILRALLGGIKVGDDPATFSGGTELTYTSDTAGEVPKLVDAILSSSKRPFITRAQVANVMDPDNPSLEALSGGAIVSSQTTDAKKEEIIGKFINLTKSEIADEFLIIVLAQSIKDTGGVKLSKDINYDGDINDNIKDFDDDGFDDVATPVSEKDVTTAYGRYDPIFDEILAEQKILVRVKYDPGLPLGRRWTIRRYEYIDE